MKHTVLVGLAILTAGPSTAADLFNGRLLFAQCAACHSLLTPGATDNRGPTLAGLFGRKAGTLSGFRFSAAMRQKGVVWTETTLHAYLTKPSAYVPGTTMIHSGIRRHSDRRDLIAYIKKSLNARR